MKKVESYDKILGIEEKEYIIKDYVENYLSLKEICKKYNIGSKEWVRKLLGNKIRSFSDSGKIAHKKYPNSFKLSEEAKNKIRKARLEWMKEHPEQTAWRTKNMSYPEKCFKKILEDNGLDKKYLIYREFSVFPYFIDYAFVNEKLAVEIDGSQHLEKNRKEKDKAKDKLLIENGWRILRITATEVMHNKEYVINVLLGMLGKQDITYEKVGILKAPKTREKAVRGEDGLTDKQRKNAYNSRKVKERPSKEDLWKLVSKKSFTEIGKIFNVSGASIKKWCKNYNLPYLKKDIDEINGIIHGYEKHNEKCAYCGKEFVSHRNGNVFCRMECYKNYIKEFGLYNKSQRKHSNFFIYKVNEDGSFINKRVAKEEIDFYIKRGWIRGRKLN